MGIVYLLSSGIPYYQFYAGILFGWCTTQFAEYLLWITNPQDGCSEMNHILTMTLVPIVLILQPLGALLGSLFLIPWDKSSSSRKQFIVVFSALIVGLVFWAEFYDIQKTCTIVTPGQHLHWHTSNFNFDKITSQSQVVIYTIWAILIITPLVVYWKKHYVFLAIALIAPSFGFVYGLYTDSKASIWCYYGSYSSIWGIIALALTQSGITNPLEWKM